MSLLTKMTDKSGDISLSGKNDSKFEFTNPFVFDTGHASYIVIKKIFRDKFVADI